MVNDFINYITFGIMIYLGFTAGENLFALLSKWADRRQHNLLRGAFLNSPDSTLGERIVILCFVIAVFSNIFSGSGGKGSLFSLLAATMTFSLLENSYTLLRGYLLVKKTCEPMTEEESNEQNHMGLNDEIFERIGELMQEGDELVKGARYDEAIEKYGIALNLVPPPKHAWEVSTWIYASIGEAYYLKEQYKQALGKYYQASNCPDGTSSAFILLRLGQSLFECEKIDKAKEYLMQAYRLEGDKIFNEEDAKYYNLIKEIYDC